MYQGEVEWYVQKKRKKREVLIDPILKVQNEKENRKKVLRQSEV